MIAKPRVLLVAMPWESASRPSLALGTLGALAQDAGFTCRSSYLNLSLAAAMGADSYNAFAENVQLFPLGEHLFAVDLFGRKRLDSERYLAKFGGTQPLGTSSPDPLHVLRDRIIPAFLDEAVAEVLQSKADVVGFTCTFNQTLPSLALARRLKLARPEVKILLGGACVHGAMGEGYAEAFAGIVDHVFTGEADRSFPLWLEACAQGQPERPIPGVTRAGSSSSGAPTIRLDDLPVPDYADYFERREHLEVAGASLTPVRHLPYESSRGCWWGEKHHCTFCGLNNEGMAFRRKSAGKVVVELETLAERHGMTSFMASDNILDHQAYRGMLADIESSSVDFDLFYEIKANVRRGDIAALRRAGVRRVQPGIESFSDHVLQLMRKGTTGLQNVSVLRMLQEHDVAVDYNILVGFPGETADDYGELIRVAEALVHLPSPNGAVTTVRVDRFSPFFDDASSLGIRDVRAAEYYRHLIPPDVIAPERYAYFFDRDESDLDEFRSQIARLNDALRRWKQRPVERRARLGPSFVELLRSDDRGRSRQVLRDLEAIVFVMADRVTSEQRLAASLSSMADAQRIHASLARLEELGAILRCGANLVATIAFEEPHREADFIVWLRRNGVRQAAMVTVAGTMDPLLDPVTSNPPAVMSAAQQN